MAIHSRLLRITRGDLDGFFGLFIDNLLQLLLIFTLCPLVCGISAEEVTTSPPAVWRIISRGLQRRLSLR